ncbi:MAG: KpsF/GutQ family sugar-phosphate isomerase [Acidobacteriota bacterium]
MSRETAKRVLKIESEAIADLIPRLGESFDQAVDLLADCKGRVVATGMGKSGIVCRKLAATLNSTGTPSIFLHPAEAIHGDLGMLAGGDVVVALSNSGETEELVKLVETIKRLGIPLISMVGELDSTLARVSDLVLDVGVNQEACPFGLAPTASTTASLALGDALALSLSERKGFHLEDFARLHPGGKLGKKLAKVADLMHQGPQLPKVHAENPMSEVIYEMSSKKLGITSVVEEGDRLIGVISDGDLRRLLQDQGAEVLSRTAGQCMNKDPLTVSGNELATSALNIMEQNKITSLMVVNDSKQVVGVIHLHDLWGTEMI